MTARWCSRRARRRRWRRRGGGRGGRRSRRPIRTASGVWRSDDGGKTWQFRSNNNNRPMYYSKIRVDPSNPEIVYTTGASASKSIDGGKKFDSMGGQSHGDHHQLWINPRNGNHLLIGNDGGLDVSYDQGETWEEINMAPGQFYAISADMRKPYYVCGGLQDNGAGAARARCAATARGSSTATGIASAAATASTRQRSARLDDRLSGIAGRRHRTLQPAHRANPGHPAARPLTEEQRKQQARTGRRARRRWRWRPRRESRRQHRAAACARHELPLLLEHAVHPVAAQPERRLSRRRSAVQVDEPRRHVVGFRRSDEQRRPQRSADHGRRRQGADGVEARRRGVVLQHHDDRRVAGDARSSGSAPTTATCR